MLSLRRIGFGLVLGLATGCAVSAEDSGGTVSHEAVSDVTQAGTGTDIGSAVIDLAAFVGAAGTLTDPATLPAAIGLAAAFSNELKDQFALVDDLMGDSPTYVTQAQFQELQNRVTKLGNQIYGVQANLILTQQKLDQEVSTLADWSVHDTLALITTSTRILADNAAPLGMNLTETQRAQLQTGVDLLEPQIDSLEFKIKNMPPSVDKNVVRLAQLTWMAAVRIRMTYAVAGIPTTRDYVLARQAFLVGMDYPMEYPGDPTPGIEAKLAFEAYWYPLFRFYLDPYAPVRGAADFDKDGYPDLVVHDVFTNKVTIWPVTADYQVGQHDAFIDGGGIVIGTADASEWRLQAIGDVDNDQNPDLIFEHPSDSKFAVWNMNGMKVRTYGQPSLDYIDNPIGFGTFRASVGRIVFSASPASPTYLEVMSIKPNGVDFIAPGTIHAFDWQPAGVGDFNGDGLSDIVWRQLTSGRVQVQMPVTNPAARPHGINVTEKDVGGTIPSNTSIRGVADFNRDGHSDLLLQDTHGQMSVWMMNGVAVNTWQALTMRPYHVHTLPHFPGLLH